MARAAREEAAAIQTAAAGSSGDPLPPSVQHRGAAPSGPPARAPPHPPVRDPNIPEAALLTGFCVPASKPSVSS